MIFDLFDNTNNKAIDLNKLRNREVIFFDSSTFNLFLKTMIAIVLEQSNDGMRTIAEVALIKFSWFDDV